MCCSLHSIVVTRKAKVGPWMSGGMDTGFALTMSRGNGMRSSTYLGRWSPFMRLAHALSRTPPTATTKETLPMTIPTTIHEFLHLIPHADLFSRIPRQPPPTMCRSSFVTARTRRHNLTSPHLSSRYVLCFQLLAVSASCATSCATARGERPVHHRSHHMHADGRLILASILCRRQRSALASPQHVVSKAAPLHDTHAPR